MSKPLYEVAGNLGVRYDLVVGRRRDLERPLGDDHLVVREIRR